MTGGTEKKLVIFNFFIGFTMEPTVLRIQVCIKRLGDFHPETYQTQGKILPVKHR